MVRLSSDSVLSLPALIPHGRTIAIIITACPTGVLTLIGVIPPSICTLDRPRSRSPRNLHVNPNVNLFAPPTIAPDSTMRLTEPHNVAKHVLCYLYTAVLSCLSIIFTRFGWQRCRLVHAQHHSLPLEVISITNIKFNLKLFYQSVLLRHIQNHLVGTRATCTVPVPSFGTVPLLVVVDLASAPFGLTTSKIPVHVGSSSQHWSPRHSPAQHWSPRHSPAQHWPPRLSTGLHGTRHLSTGLHGTRLPSPGLHGTRHLSPGLRGTRHLSTGLHGTRLPSTGLHGSALASTALACPAIARTSPSFPALVRTSRYSTILARTTIALT